jgi:dihydroorotase
MSPAPVSALVLRRPDDLHVHFREGASLETTVPEMAAVFGRAVAMPNLSRPLVAGPEAVAYGEALVAVARAHGHHGFTPIVPLYLTPATTPTHIAEAAGLGIRTVKLYPAGATTASEHGVRGLDALDPVFEAMATHGLLLLIHGEAIDPDVDLFDREAVFVARDLPRLRARHPGLRIVLEHVTTAAGVEAVKAARDGHLAATITPHHLLHDRNALFAGGMRPHLYCLPIPKTRVDRAALLAAAISGDPRFFLGSDSAPHPKHRKESACCPAGVYTGAATLALYAEAFASAEALARLPDFASRFGADFYGLPLNADEVELVREPWRLPEVVRFGDAEAVPYRAGETLPWQVRGVRFS